MVTNNTLITAPVSIADVKTVLGATSNDLGTLCGRNNINMWARYRPTGGGCIKNRKKENGSNENYNTLYNINVPLINASNFKNNLKWSSNITHSYYRLQDFNGYNHSAKSEFDNNMLKFYPTTTYHNQSGIFYNCDAQLIVQLMPTNNANTNSAPQCWEDATEGMSIDTYSPLKLENLSYNGIKINNHNAYDHMIGVAFIIDNSTYLLSTGVTLNKIFGSASSVNIEIEKAYNTDVVNLGTCYYGGQKFLLYLNLKGFNDIRNSNIFPTNGSNKLIYSRIVLIWPEEGEANEMFLQTDFDGNNVYSFELVPNFCSSGTNGLTLKKLNNYVNILDTNRNSGLFFDSDLSNGVETENYVYQNGDWVRNSGHPPFSFSQLCKMSFIGNCDGAGVISSTGGYKKYRLYVRGCVCCEFKPKESTTSDDPQVIVNTRYENYMVDDSSINKKATLTLKLKSSGSGTNINLRDVYMKFGSENYFVFSSGNSSGQPTAYLNTGSTWSRTYTKGNVEETGSDGKLQIKGCNKKYNSSQGHYSMCHSEMLFIDGVKSPNTSNTFYTGIDDAIIYIWLQAAVADYMYFDLVYNGVSSTVTVGQITS